MSPDDVRTLAELLDSDPLARLAWRAGTAAGAFLADERPRGLAIDTKSTPTDVVTAMDRTAEALISTSILGDRPDDGLLGEEGGERIGSSGVRWIVDPLDGTVNYLFGLPLWGVSIAAERDGVVTVGVVLTPELGEGYLGIRGGGAWHIVGGRAERMAGSSCDDLSSALVATGFGYDAERRRRQATVVAGLIGQVRDIRRMGSAVIDLCWVARGRLDGYFERGLNPWDYAAGALIAAEAGMSVGGLADDGLSEIVVACSPAIAVPFRAALRDLDAGRT